MLDKRMSVDEIVDQLSDGMTIGIGGWRLRSQEPRRDRARRFVAGKLTAA